jgi:hypothetical protein
MLHYFCIKLTAKFLKSPASINRSWFTTLQQSLTALLLALSLILQIAIGVHQAYYLDAHDCQQAFATKSLASQSTQVNAKTLPLEQASLRNSNHWGYFSLGFGFCVLPHFLQSLDQHQLKLSNFLKADNKVKTYLTKYYHYLALLSVF